MKCAPHVRLALAFPMLALAAPAQEDSPVREVRFGRVARAVEETRSRFATMSVDIDLTMSIEGEVVRTVPWDMARTERAHVTTLACHDGKATKIELRFEELTSQLPGPEGPVRIESPLVGEAVVVERSGEEWPVTDTEGLPIADVKIVDAARAEARKLWSDERPSITDLLPDEPMRIGQSIELGGAEALQAVGGPSTGAPDEVAIRLTLTGTKVVGGDDVAVFDAVLDLTDRQNAGLEMSIELTGELWIGVADSRVRSAELKGDLHLGGGRPHGEQRLTYSGVGPAVLDFKSSYGRVK